MQAKDLIKKGSSKKEVFLLIFIIMLGFFLRINRIDDTGLWYDEFLTYSRSQESLFTIISKWSPYPFHYIPTHFILYLGHSDGVIRIPPVLFGTCTILLIYLVGKTLFNYEEGLLSALLLSISVYHIRYSQEIRYYSYVTFFTLFSFYFLLKLIQGKFNKKNITGFLLSVIFYLITHRLTLIILLIEIIILLCLLLKNYKSIFTIFEKKKNSITLSSNIIFTLFGSFFCWLLLKNLLNVMRNVHLFGSTKYLEFSSRFFLDILSQFGFGQNIYSTFILPLFFLAGIISLLENSKWKGSLLLFWIFMPFVILFTFSMKHHFSLKYIIYILPIYYIIVSKGITSIASILLYFSSIKIQNQKIIFSFFITFILFSNISIFSLEEYYQRGQTDLKGAAQYLEDHIEKNDIIIVDTPIFTKYFKNNKYNPIIGSNIKLENFLTLSKNQGKNTWFIISHDYYAFRKFSQFQSRTSDYHNYTVEIVEEKSFPGGIFIYKMYFGQTINDNRNFLKNSFYASNITYDHFNNMIYPKYFNQMGEIIYRIDRKKHKNIFFRPKYSILFPYNYIKFYLSNNNSNYVLSYEINGTKNTQEKSPLIRVFDKISNNTDHFYLKIELYVNNKTSKTIFDSRIESIKFFSLIPHLPKNTIMLKNKKCNNNIIFSKMNSNHSFSGKIILNNFFEKSNLFLDKHNDFIYPEKFNEKSIVIYKINLINTTQIIFNPKFSIMYKNNYIKIYTRFSNTNYSLQYQLNGTSFFQEIIPQIKIIKNNTSEADTLFIKIEQFVSNKTSKTNFDTRVEAININLTLKHSFLDLIDNSLIYSDDFSTPRYLIESYDISNISINIREYWKKNKHLYDNKPSVIHPTYFDQKAHIIYSFQDDHEATIFVLKPKYRLVQPNNKIIFYNSLNGTEYNLLYEINGKSEEKIKSPRIYVFPKKINRAKTNFIKIEMYVNEKNSINNFDVWLENFEVYGLNIC